MSEGSTSVKEPVTRYPVDRLIRERWSPRAFSDRLPERYQQSEQAPRQRKSLGEVVYGGWGESP
jgi:hypothetical protein